MRSHRQVLRQYQEQARRYLRPREEQALDLAVDLLMEQEIQELTRETESAYKRTFPGEQVPFETSETSWGAGALTQETSTRNINALAVLYLRFKGAMTRRECLALETALDLARQRAAEENNA